MSNHDRPRWRFGTSNLLMLILLSAAMMGWWSARKTAQQHQEFIISQQTRQAIRMDLIESSIKSIYGKKARVAKQTAKTRRLFSHGDFSASNFAGAVIRLRDPAFRSSSFDGVNFDNAMIVSGASSFQHASFDYASLRNVTLSAGPASFQCTRFVAADLTDATLTATGSAFQAGSLRDAILHRTVFQCGSISDFQVVDISNADFSGADLSAIKAECLISCYFFDPPKYDRSTKFPTGFDPGDQKWKLLQNESDSVRKPNQPARK